MSTWKRRHPNSNPILPKSLTIHEPTDLQIAAFISYCNEVSNARRRTKPKSKIRKATQ